MSSPNRRTLRVKKAAPKAFMTSSATRDWRLCRRSISSRVRFSWIAFCPPGFRYAITSPRATRRSNRGQQPRWRRATYRLQLNAECGFDQAAGIADYLAALGVSHLYTSPYLQAAPGSTHGYDVVDHSRLSRELGGPEAHGRMIAALKRSGLGHLIDTVPNHMSISTRENRWWWDVLQNGLASAYARFFDVDWEPPEARLRNTVLLPVLADQYGRALDRGEIRLHRQRASFTIQYKDHEFPVDPRSLAGTLRKAAAQAGVERLEFI